MAMALAVGVGMCLAGRCAALLPDFGISWSTEGPPLISREFPSSVALAAVREVKLDVPVYTRWV